ncbi:hypothetical protein [Agrobacterium tumefaciens]|uniref:Uncharacterized protein n=1 Tax=Agrobacterium tumefaciens TaxID=358 RepID=A0A4D7YL13_AGRTU|nr:hypothetical protein [Agrobacterium tumefaciens]QCL96067.1 hypothetical protein CFBP7129_17530 [Agrobacterium tumefaciens]
MEDETGTSAKLCTCEEVAHGALGKVANDEKLARVIMSPTHFKKNGELKPGAFPLSHIRQSGLSLFRTDRMTKEDIVRIAGAIAPPNQTPHSLAIAVAADIRSIELVEGEQALCVLDDPVLNSPPFPDNPAHAIAISSTDRTSEDCDPEVLELQEALLTKFKAQLRRIPDGI